MKILVATEQGQGVRKNDFCFVPEGEPVTFGFECERDNNPDDHCGCHRAMCGVKSHRATTTFMSANIKLTKKAYFELLKEGLKSAGWLEGGFITDEIIHQQVETLLDAAKSFRPGVVLEKRGPVIQTRELKKQK